MKMKTYDHKKLEKKWQSTWEKKKIYEAKSPSSRANSPIKQARLTTGRSARKKFYALIEFPYPSGDGLHVGHPRPYIGMDVISRKRRMQGFNVLYPIGWDAFGLPTENYAIKTGKDPRVVTKKNTDTFRRQIKSLGVSFDWSREINTTDPKYYKWTQWIFLQFLKKGLAYKAKININWCPKDKTGLANEEVIAGACERCGTLVEKKEKEQWMLAITKYADRLDKDLDDVDYLPQIKLGQRNWIGRSEGAEIEFELNTHPPTPSQKEGAFGYHTTDPKTWRALQDRVLEMRKNSTPAEEKLWQALRKNLTGEHFRRQHIIGRFITDFVCLEKSLVIEVDGDIHDYQKKEDEERTEFLRQNGFRVIRFNNREVLADISEVLQKISFELKALPFGEGLGGVIKVFTTRPDTIFGVTFLAIAPEIAKKITGKDYGIKIDTDRPARNAFSKADAGGENKPARHADASHAGGEKIGVDTGLKAKNPANCEMIPVWVVNYVSADYGTGAVMGVPGDDERDREFAEKYNLPIIENYKKAGTEDFGKKVIHFKLRDWVFSRQRYWGEPIPVVNCEKCGLVPVPEKDLPVLLPKVKNYQPTDTGESPLANISKWVNTTCLTCGGKAKRETDTMPNWAGSSWYYLAYLFNKKSFSGKASLENWKLEIENLKYWTPVDWYNGGNEHTTLHLLYSRFWHKFLYDLKLVPTSEPYMKRTSHGMILAEGGEKMSKSKGNVINPDDIIKIYGADTLRLYEMFMGPFDQAIAWSEEAIIGPRRFLERVWNLKEKVSDEVEYDSRGRLEISLNNTVKKVSEDIESMHFNTAISSMMILVNALATHEKINEKIYRTLLLLLAPFAPHMAEELWAMLGENNSIHLSAWPEWDPNKILDEKIKIVVQINGKVRTEIFMEVDEKEEEIKNKALNNDIVRKYTENKTIKNIIYVKNRLINIVV